MLWNVIENNCSASTEICRELEPALATNQGVGRGIVLVRGREDSSWAGAGGKQGL